MHQLRVLVCDGPALLAWVGGFTFDPVSASQQRALTALVPALRDRLRLEQQLAPVRARAAALDLALEQVPGAAFLLDGRGQARCTNGLGRSRLDRDPRGLAAALQLAVRQRASDAAFVVSPLLERGLPAYHLLVERPAVNPHPTADRGPDHTDRGADPAESWSLTPREREVLSLLLDGMANRSIALCLDCSERTVETHVSRVLAKAGVESRAQLIRAVLDHNRRR
ncbi:MAG: hypothetical protein IT371_00270 [Deltaproteobacteria bacterium]|nr:hypothetical protein [Deltaproteobacteria bacterium]